MYFANFVYVVRFVKSTFYFCIGLLDFMFLFYCTQHCNSVCMTCSIKRLLTYLLTYLHTYLTASLSHHYCSVCPADCSKANKSSQPKKSVGFVTIANFASKFYGDWDATVEKAPNVLTTGALCRLWLLISECAAVWWADLDNACSPPSLQRVIHLMYRILKPFL